MKMIRKTAACSFLLITLITLMGAGCAMRPLFHPDGTRLGSCSGKMKMVSGLTAKFTFSVYRGDDGEINGYISIPRLGVRYNHVDEINFDDGFIHVETDAPEREYSGQIILKSLKFEGSLGPVMDLTGLEFDLDD